MAENLPAAQAAEVVTQAPEAVDPTGDVPVVHASHAVAAVAAAYVPAAQAVHAAPVPARNWPATHAVQSSAESFEVSLERAARNLPFAHVVQDAESAAAQVPAPQSMHAVRPVASPVD